MLWKPDGAPIHEVMSR